ncbi:hypothetical protein [Nocardia sp. NBC_01327]|uniref:hypothetical protein n=1 Tax=Nocardia sp. NBC_01327 TaxID=2903593 RepID=UPI002E10944B|nr:hypothetical protein OG326_41830 [Nocardia sp. NBC_01327]
MAIPLHINRVHAITSAISATAGQLTPESVAAACAVELLDVECATPEVRELQGCPADGPFSIVSLRLPLTEHRGPSPALILTPRAGARLYQSDLEKDFTFARDLIRIDPRIRPEGTVSFLEQRDDTTLTFEFTGRSRLLRKLTIQQNC